MENKTFVDVEYLLECRRNAYISCSMSFMEQNNVVGYFGENLPLHFFYGSGLLPVPLEDIDREIFQFSSENLKKKNFCDCIQSTLTYLETDKCPILYSCKAYIFTDACPVLLSEFQSCTTKPCFSVTESEESIKLLKEFLKSISKLDYDFSLEHNAKEKLDTIEKIYKKIENFSTISCEELFALKYYSPYITNLDERLEFFKLLESIIPFVDVKVERSAFSASCPRGYFKSIVSKIPSLSKLYWGKGVVDFADKACIYKGSQQAQY